MPGTPRYGPLAQFWRRTAGRPPLPTLGGSDVEGAGGPARQRRSDIVLPATGRAAAPGGSRIQKDRPNAGPPGHLERAQRQLPADFHRRAAAAGGPPAFLERLLDREMGGRHAGGGDQRAPGWHVAPPQREPDYGGRQSDRAVPASELRPSGDRSHHGRSQSVHEGVDHQDNGEYR